MIVVTWSEKINKKEVMHVSKLVGYNKPKGGFVSNDNLKKEIIEMLIPECDKPKRKVHRVMEMKYEKDSY